LSNRKRSRNDRGTPLVRTPPTFLELAEVDELLGAFRRWRDSAMVEAMVFGALRRAEVLGLRFDDLKVKDHLLFIADGKGGHQQIVPVSARFFDSVATYLRHERPKATATDRLPVLKGSNAGSPLSLKGLDQWIVPARDRVAIAHCTCHELRRTCLSRLRAAGISLEAIQAQAGHRSIESTRIYLHFSNDWLADECLRASDAIFANRFTCEVLAINVGEYQCQTKSVGVPVAHDGRDYGPSCRRTWRRRRNEEPKTVRTVTREGHRTVDLGWFLDRPTLDPTVSRHVDQLA
jgi:integrase/recombinase XerD